MPPCSDRARTPPAAIAAALGAFVVCLPGIPVAAAGLDEPVRAAWKAIPLRDWAARASVLAGLPVVVDRRLDPAVTITLDCRGEPLREVLVAAAAAADADVALLASSIRLVPRGQRDLCERAEDARDHDIANLPRTTRAVVSRRAPWAWPDAARPRDLVASAAAAAKIRLDGLDTLPHDHFPAADLPPLSLAERLDLVLAHFDRRVAWRLDGPGHGTIVPLDAGLPAPRVRPAARPKPSGREGRPRGPVRADYTLRVAAPLDDLLAALGRQFALTPELDVASLRARGIAPEEVIRADFQHMTRDELLDALLGPLGLVWRIEAGRLRVFAPPPETGP